MKKFALVQNSRWAHTIPVPPFSKAGKEGFLAGCSFMKMAERRKRNVEQFIWKPERSRLEKSVFRKDLLLFASPDPDLSRRSLWPGQVPQ
jgi:hypothetical protein